MGLGQPGCGRRIQWALIVDVDVPAVLAAAEMAHDDVGEDRQHDGVRVGDEQLAARLHGQGIGLQGRGAGGERAAGRRRVQQAARAGRGLVADAGGPQASRAQQLVDAVPDHFAADPAGVQGIEHVHIAFGEDFQSSHPPSR